MEISKREFSMILTLFLQISNRILQIIKKFVGENNPNSRIEKGFNLKLFIRKLN